MPLQALVLHPTDNLTLDAGNVAESALTYEITPPALPLIDQLIAFLDGCPNQVTSYRTATQSIGLCALAVRWGSYFATLVDEAAPLHPDIAGVHHEQPETYSFISDSEMRRLNIEISHNLYRLVQVYRERGNEAFLVLLAKAHHYLPMPHKSMSMDRELALRYFSCLATGAELIDEVKRGDVPGLFKTPLPNGEMQYSMRYVKSANVDRFIGNVLTVQGWRNTIIEDIHAGKQPPHGLQPFQRRLTRRAYLAVMREITANCGTAAFMWDTLFNPNFSFRDLPSYPATADALAHSYCGLSGTGWTLTDAASTVTLYKPA